jgi:hypothetical protein
MRKLIMLLVAVFAVLASSTTSAATPRKAVTIKATPPIVVFGGTVTLSGTVSSPKSGEKVDILAEEVGAASFNAVTTVDTAAGGTFSDVVTPNIETMYQASWQRQTSRTVTVKVRPAIKLSLMSVSGRVATLSTTVTAARSFAGKFVLVQRLSSPRPHVLQVRKVTLDENSSATFRMRLHHGRTRIRVVIPTSQAAPGYITGFSNVLTINR